MRIRNAMLAAAAALLPGAAAAQQLEEIVVTATKREQSIQDVPLSIFAVTGDQLRSRGTERLSDAAMYVPNLKISTSDGSAKNINMRGLGSGNNRGFETSVGLYLDGVYLGRENFITDAFIDLERMEVIRGPQGALFGKNTIAGAVSMITRAPAAKREAEIAVTLGDNDKRVVEAAASGPITDTLSGRLYVQSHRRDGYYRNTFSGREDGSRDVDAARVRLAWAPVDAFDLSLTLQYADLEHDGMSRQLGPSVPCRAIGTVAGCTAAGVSSPYSAGGTRSIVDVARTADPLVETNWDETLSIGPSPTGESRSTLFTAATANYRFADHTLTYVGGYAKIINQVTRLDADTTPLDINFLTNAEDYSQRSHELRLASPADRALSYIVGVYRFESDIDGYQDLTVRAPVPGPPQGAVRSTALQETESSSVFGQTTWRALEALRLIAGVRYVDEDKSAALAQARSPTLFIFPNYSTSAKFSDDDTLLNGAVQYDLTPDVMAYANYNQGFKAGGINFFSLNGTNFTYQSEESDGYEVGIKSKLAGGSAMLNVALFRTKFDNLQTSSLNNNVVVVANAASAESKGVEVDMTWQITESFRTQLAFAYLDAGYADYPNAPCTARQIVNRVGACSQELSNGKLEGAPQTSGAWNLTYRTPLAAASAHLTIAADVLYSDEYFLFGSGDNDPLDKQGSWFKYSARVALDADDDSWSLALIGKNLSNRQTGYSGLDVFQFPGSHFVQMDPPRQIEAQFTYRWR